MIRTLQVLGSIPLLFMAWYVFRLPFVFVWWVFTGDWAGWWWF